MARTDRLDLLTSLFATAYRRGTAFGKHGKEVEGGVGNKYKRKERREKRRQGGRGRGRKGKTRRQEGSGEREKGRKSRSSSQPKIAGKLRLGNHGLVYGLNRGH